MARPYLTEEIAIKNIINLIEKINKRNNNSADIEFLGFSEQWKGRDTKLILKCKKHNIIWKTTSYKNLHSLRHNGCPKCSSDIKKETSSLTAEEAYNIVVELHKNDGRNYDYTKILTTFKGYNNIVTITCPIHGDFNIRYSTLLIKDNNTVKGNCPKCIREQNKIRLLKNEAIRKINERINEINIEFNTDIEFINFVGNEYKNVNTKLILKCKKHNIIWDTTSFRTLVYSKRGPICPICSANQTKKVSKKEKECLKLLTKYIPKENIIPQFEFKNIYNLNFKITRKLYVDFYIVFNNRKIILEFNGEQHILFKKYFHNTYQDFINQVNRDNFLKTHCKENNIELLIIQWIDRNRIPEILKAFFEEGKDITTKVEPKLLPVLYHG